MIRNIDYDNIMSWLQPAVRPAAGAQVAEQTERIRQGLEASGLFHTVEIEATDDPDQMVIAIVGFDYQMSTHWMVDDLDALWADQLRDATWHRNTISLTEHELDMRGVTRLGADGDYLTVRIVAEPRVAPYVEAPAPVTVPAQGRRWFSLAPRRVALAS